MRRLICIVITLILVTMILLYAVSDINYGYGPGYVPDYGDDYGSDYGDDYGDSYGDDYSDSYENGEN